MRITSAALFTVLLTAPAFAQQVGPGSTISFEGVAVVTAVTDACAPTDIVVGSAPRLVYRFKNASSDPNDALAFYFDKSAFRIFSNDASGSLNGNFTGESEDLINGYAGHSSDANGASNLQISSANPTTTAYNTNNLKINGTLINAYFTPGCSITFRSALARRPIQ